MITQLIFDVTKFKMLSCITQPNQLKSWERSLFSYLRNLKRVAMIDKATCCGSTAGSQLKSTKLVAPFAKLSPSSVSTYNYNLYLLSSKGPKTDLLESIHNQHGLLLPALLWTGQRLITAPLPENNEIMCSFDVCSFFTNLPPDETIEICPLKLYFLPDRRTAAYLQRSLFATKKSHFIFDGHYND